MISETSCVDQTGVPPPLVSIVIPTFDRLHLLGTAINSALAQTYSNIEVIVSDDQSCEKVSELVSSFCDKRIRYRTNQGVVGPTRNALAAYTEASGAYIGTLHDDDAWEPTFLERLVPPLDADEDLVLAFSDHWVMNAGGAINLRASELNTRRWKRDGLREGVYRPFYQLAVLDRAVPVAVSTVFRKSAIDWMDYPTEMEPLYDLWIGYLAARDGRGAYYCPDRLTRYRVHRSSITGRGANERAAAYCFERFISDVRLRPIRHALRRASAPRCVSLGIAHLKNGSRRAAWRQLALGLSRRPDLRGLFALALTFLPISGERLARLVQTSRTPRHRGPSPAD